MAADKKPFHETVAEKLIEQLKAGTAPWQRPWDANAAYSFLPFNPTTGKRYKGINAVYLMAQDYSDPRWMTYKQAAAINAQVRKGEKGTPVQYWKFTEEQDKVDENGRPVLDSSGKPVKETVALERPRVFFATVFNAEQIDGLPPLEQRVYSWDAIERAEHILGASGAKIVHSPTSSAFYRSSTDSIYLPDKTLFPSADRYYATALHELGHWTGHPSRLDRDLSNPYGSEGYAKEELRAEIASMMLGEELGIGHDPGQHVAYVKSWIQVLQEDPLEIFRAAADAEKIKDFVLAFEQKQVQEVALQEDHAIATNERSERASDELSGETLLEQLQEAGVQIGSHEEAFKRWDRGERIYAFHEQDEEPVRVVSFDMLLNYAAAQLIALPGLQQVQDHEQARATPTESSQETPMHGRIYLDVPFKEKNEVKALGARWDRQERAWYVPNGKDLSAFSKWPVKAQRSGTEEQSAETANAQSKGPERVYLAVPFGERKAAKAAGAQWDKIAKSWYVIANKSDMDTLKRWLPENVPNQQAPAMSPVEEFADALTSLGCIVSGQHPIMDGKKHRIPVAGDKKGEQSGFYVGHVDGHPAGYIKNNRTGIEMKWKSKGYVLDENAKAQLRAEAAKKLAEREIEQERLHEATALRVSKQAGELAPVTAPTAYMRTKGIEPQEGVLTDKDGQKTYIPAFDVNGKQWTMQYIQEDGTKRFAKDSKKEGCFHPIGGMDALAGAPALVIAEGYATACTIAEVLGFATVAAFDSGNLPLVAKALHERFPEKPVVIAGDDDRHLMLSQGVNPGKEKALEAAKIVGGKAIFPVFGAGEGVYPDSLPPITPQLYRQHLAALETLKETPDLTDQQKGEVRGSLLSDEQLSAYEAMKRFTDFNDLLTHSALGRAGLERQVGASVGKVLAEAGRKQMQPPLQQRVQQRGQQLRRSLRA